MPARLHDLRPPSTCGKVCESELRNLPPTHRTIHSLSSLASLTVEPSSVRSPFAPSRLLYSLCDMTSTDQPTRSQMTLPLARTTPGFFVKEDEYLVNYAAGDVSKIPLELLDNVRADFELSTLIKASALPLVNLDAEDLFEW